MDELLASTECWHGEATGNWSPWLGSWELCIRGLRPSGAQEAEPGNSWRPGPGEPRSLIGWPMAVRARYWLGRLSRGRAQPQYCGWRQSQGPRPREAPAMDYWGRFWGQETRTVEEARWDRGHEAEDAWWLPSAREDWWVIRTESGIYNLYSWS